MEAGENMYTLLLLVRAKSDLLAVDRWFVYQPIVKILPQSPNTADGPDQMPTPFLAS
jgi:hypothetical protein